MTGAKRGHCGLHKRCEIGYRSGVKWTLDVLKSIIGCYRNRGELKNVLSRRWRWEASQSCSGPPVFCSELLLYECHFLYFYSLVKRRFAVSDASDRPVFPSSTVSPNHRLCTREVLSAGRALCTGKAHGRHAGRVHAYRRANQLAETKVEQPRCVCYGVLWVADSPPGDEPWDRYYTVRHRFSPLYRLYIQSRIPLSGPPRAIHFFTVPVTRVHSGLWKDTDVELRSDCTE